MDEKRAILANLPKTQPMSGAKTWDWAQAMKLLKDPSFFTFTLLWICHAIGGWGVSTVLPTVIYELGMTGTAEAQLMTIVSANESLTKLLNDVQYADKTLSTAYICLRLCLLSLHRLAHPPQVRVALDSCYSK